MLASLGKLDLADNQEGKETEIDLLIGLDAYWKFVMPRPTVKTLPDAERWVAQETVFGWIVSGSLVNPREQCLSSVAVFK